MEQPPQPPTPGDAPSQAPSPAPTTAASPPRAAAPPVLPPAAARPVSHATSELLSSTAAASVHVFAREQGLAGDTLRKLTKTGGKEVVEVCDALGKARAGVARLGETVSQARSVGARMLA